MLCHPDVERMLATIEAETAATAGLTGRSRISPQVLGAMRKVPREAFVPPGRQGEAFGNYPLPIGQGQTISQPFIVALMTDLLKPHPGQRLLEIGTGSGYQAAILSLLVHEVYSLEIIPTLAERAARRLVELGFANVAVKWGNGYDGWPEQAPFDGIIVTAAAPHIPPPLLEQLKPGGRLVIPVGLPYRHQELLLMEKIAVGQQQTRKVLGVAFVPLTGSR